jgi:hypothetical protein
MPCEHFVSAASAAFLCTLERMNSEDIPFRFETGFLCNYKPVDYARNVIVDKFLANPEASRLWFIDSDIVPAPNSLQLILHRGDIVAAPYPFWGSASIKKQEELEEAVAEATWGTYKWNYDGGGFNQPGVLDAGLFEYDAAPTGMMIIRRRVFEDQGMLFPSLSHPKVNGNIVTMAEGDVKPFFRNMYQFTGAYEATEDMEFCWRARKHGYRTLIDNGVKCGHLKMVNLKQVMDFAVRSYEKGCSDLMKVVAAAYEEPQGVSVRAS